MKWVAAVLSVLGGTVVRVDGSRHFIMLDQPERFDQLLQAFLQQ